MHVFRSLRSCDFQDTVWQKLWTLVQAALFCRRTPTRQFFEPHGCKVAAVAAVAAAVVVVFVMRVRVHLCVCVCVWIRCTHWVVMVSCLCSNVTLSCPTSSMLTNIKTCLHHLQMTTLNQIKSRSVKVTNRLCLWHLWTWQSALAVLA